MQAHVLLTVYTVFAQLTTVVLCSAAHGQILDIGREELALEPTVGPPLLSSRTQHYGPSLSQPDSIS